MHNGILIYALALNLAALVVYLAAGAYIYRLAVLQQPIQGPWATALLTTAVLFHWSGLYPLIIAEQGVNFSFFATGSLVSATINTLVLLSSLRKPVQVLYTLLIPFSLLSIVLLLRFHQVDHFSQLAQGIAFHVVLSLLAYSLLAIATAQALLLAYQTHQLKHHQPGRLLRQLLPPLQTMEALLFELLWLGFALLTLALISGWLYVDNLMAQHLAHKTVFSVIGWLVYACLLAGRHWLGWRGYTAIRFTLGGFAALMLAYFGSKFVLELVLNVQ